MSKPKHDPSHQSTISHTIRQQRIMLSMTINDLAEKSGISASHLGRVERGERFPSGQVLRKIAKPLGFKEEEIMALAGYMSSDRENGGGIGAGTIPCGGVRVVGAGYLDPYVASVLRDEPVTVQRVVIGILRVLKELGKTSDDS